MTNTTLTIGAAQMTAVSDAVDAQLATALLDEARTLAPTWAALTPEGEARARIQMVIAVCRHAGMADDEHVRDAVLACAAGDVPVPLPEAMVALLHRTGVTARMNRRDFAVECRVRSDLRMWQQANDIGQVVGAYQRTYET